MWDTKYSDWSAKKMGPKRDVVGLLEKAIRAEGMRFLVALHHAENWWFYAHWRKDCDTSDPRYVGLYGELHNLDGSGQSGDFFFDQDRPSKRFMQTWKNKSREVIDKYSPDVLWFDFGLRWIPEQYRQDLMAYYYNSAARQGREVVITFKDCDFAPGTGVQDFELGRLNALAHHDWITDSTVDDGQGWGYLKQTGYKTPASVIHYLVDNVSKNGALLLNIGPKPNGEIPEEAKTILKETGKWLAVNGEAIFNTSNWIAFGEGPAQLKKAGGFNEDEKPAYSAKDVRFTVKGNALYATCLGWPAGPVTIETLKSLYAAEIQSVRMLGVDRDLKWKLDGKGLTITPPAKKPCEHAYAFRIVRGKPY
jgi:alpha-L-fucosidase